MTPAERFGRRLDGAPPKPQRKYTDEDAAFAVAQWCSGITQKEIAQHFGYANSTMICVWIDTFIRKHYTGVPIITVYGKDRIDGYCDNRKALAKIAFCHFMAQREEAGAA